MSAASWESNDSGHRATLRAAGEFASDSYRRKSASKGVDMILGKHESNTSVLKVQSIVFDKEQYPTQADAKKWFAENSSDVDKEYDSRSGAKLDGKSIREVGITKRLTMLQSAGAASGEVAKDAGVQQPTPDQLRLINTFTRSPKVASEVAVFPVLACNDIVDRDVDRFTPATVEGFLQLAGPLSPIGKSFMVGHDYRQLPVGRIFDGSTENIEGVNWLKLWTYMPNTDQYKTYLENVDFGIYWAVSVGVMLGASTCSVGDPHEWGWHPYVCSQGHMKGERYDPNGETGATYDMVAPTDSGQLCWRNLEDPQDFYELSQVYLGAQYYAAYSDKVAEGVTKSFAKGGVDMAKAIELYESDAHILTLTAEEAAELPSPFPEGSKIAAASELGLPIEQLDDGTRKFTDGEGLVWLFDVNGDETCLGKSSDAPDTKDAIDPEDEDEGGEDGDESKGAIACNHGGTSDSPWSGPAAEKALGTDADKATLRAAYAWVDGSSDGTKKANYKFIHHFVSSGKVGDASTVACSTGIGVLNGGRQGTTIPSGDRKGVYNHLAGHLRDAGKDVPDLKAIEDLPEGDAPEREEVVARLIEVGDKAALAAEKDTGDNSLPELLASIDATIDAACEAMDEQDYATADAMLTAADELIDEILEAAGIEDPDEQGGSQDDEPTLDNMSQSEASEEDQMSKANVLRSVRGAKLPASVVEAAAGAEGTGLDEALKAAGTEIADLHKQVSELTPKASLGDTYIKELRADAIHWYTMANQADAETGVDVTKIERLLDMCGDNAELIKEQREMYRDLARAKFPEAVRRSTFPDAEVNERHEVAAPEQPAPGTTGAKRIHG